MSENLRTISSFFAAYDRLHTFKPKHQLPLYLSISSKTHLPMADSPAATTAPPKTPTSAPSKAEKLKLENKKLKQLVKMAKDRIEAQEKELKSQKEKLAAAQTNSSTSASSSSAQTGPEFVITKVLARTKIDKSSFVNPSTSLYTVAPTDPKEEEFHALFESGADVDPGAKLCLFVRPLLATKDIYANS